ncbi:MAG: DUF4361 domain-containing protein [Saprospiraceae bacterium]|nr:DUF4361 domain-containing protein [Saprospiraceae bacterium]
MGESGGISNNFLKYKYQDIMKFKYIIGLFLLGCLASCIEEGGNAIEGIGENFVRIPAGADEINITALDATAGTKKVVLMDVFRDANSQASLNTASDVKLKVDNSLITQYNTENGTSFVPLEGGYSLESLDLKFGAGEFGKKVYLSVDPSKLDLTKQFALGLSIESSTGGFNTIPSLDRALFNVVIKNEWHGTYQAVGVFHHPTAGDRAINRVKDLSTSGPNSVIAELGDLGGSGYFMVLTINPDNSVTITPSGVTPNVDQSYGPNTYDPATHSFKLWYAYNVAAPRITEETLTLK